MSGLVVRPGDTLFLCVDGTWPGTREEVERDFEARMPGVKVVLTGHMGGPFAYRPDPPTLPTLPCCGFTDVHASFCPTRQTVMTDAEIDALPDDAPKLAEIAQRRRRMSKVDSPVIGEPQIECPQCPCGAKDLVAQRSSRFEGQGGWDISCVCGNSLMYTLHLNSEALATHRGASVRVELRGAP